MSKKCAEKISFLLLYFLALKGLQSADLYDIIVIMHLYAKFL